MASELGFVSIITGRRVEGPAGLRIVHSGGHSQVDIVAPVSLTDESGGHLRDRLAGPPRLGFGMPNLFGCLPPQATLPAHVQAVRDALNRIMATGQVSETSQKLLIDAFAAHLEHAGIPKYAYEWVETNIGYIDHPSVKTTLETLRGLAQTKEAALLDRREQVRAAVNNLRD